MRTLTHSNITLLGPGQNIRISDHPGAQTVRHVHRMVRFDNVLQTGLTGLHYRSDLFAQIAQQT